MAYFLDRLTGFLLPTLVRPRCQRSRAFLFVALSFGRFGDRMALPLATGHPVVIGINVDPLTSELKPEESAHATDSGEERRILDEADRRGCLTGFRYQFVSGPFCRRPFVVRSGNSPASPD